MDDIRREIAKRLSEYTPTRPGQCVACRDGRLVAQGESLTAVCARRFALCQRCYNDRGTRKARRVAMGLGAWRRRM